MFKFILPILCILGGLTAQAQEDLFAHCGPVMNTQGEQVEVSMVRAGDKNHVAVSYKINGVVQDTMAQEGMLAKGVGRMFLSGKAYRRIFYFQDSATMIQLLQSGENENAQACFIGFAPRGVGFRNFQVLPGQFAAELK